MPCDKRPYPGQKSARKAGSGASWRIHTYECPECGMWHLSNGDKQERRAFRRRKEDRWPNNKRIDGRRRER